MVTSNNSNTMSVVRIGCAQGFRVVRFWNPEMEEDINRVMQTILQRLREATPHPPAPSPARGEGEKK